MCTRSLCLLEAVETDCYAGENGLELVIGGEDGSGCGEGVSVNETVPGVLTSSSARKFTARVATARSGRIGEGGWDGGGPFPCPPRLVVRLTSLLW